jgi:hypothetical protein
VIINVFYLFLKPLTAISVNDYAGGKRGTTSD